MAGAATGLGKDSGFSPHSRILAEIATHAHQNRNRTRVFPVTLLKQLTLTLGHTRSKSVDIQWPSGEDVAHHEPMLLSFANDGRKTEVLFAKGAMTRPASKPKWAQHQVDCYTVTSCDIPARNCNVGPTDAVGDYVQSGHSTASQRLSSWTRHECTRTDHRSPVHWH